MMKILCSFRQSEKIFALYSANGGIKEKIMSKSTQNKSGVISKTVVKPVIKVVANKVSIPHHLSQEAIAKDLIPRFTGVMVDAETIYNAKTGEFMREKDLVRCGCSIIWVDYYADVSKRATKKSRETQNVRTFKIFKKQKYGICTNIDWTNWINKRSSEDGFIAGKPTNKIFDSLNCKAVGEKDGRYYVKGVIIGRSGSVEYFNENGDLLDYTDISENYMPVKSAVSKQKQSEKYGIEVDKIPFYTTTAIDSCSAINAFGIKYIPTPE